jgi:hypothetical protein
MRAIALAWGVLGLAGIALSVAAVARLPADDLVDAFIIVIVLVTCTGGFLSLWFVVREWWPDIREWRVGYRIELGWYLTVVVPVIGFGAITATLTEAVRQPIAGPFRLAALFTVSLVTLWVFWAFRANPDFVRGPLRLTVIIATVTCLTVLILVRHDLGVAWGVGAIASLALCIATLWQLRSSRHT